MAFEKKTWQFNDIITEGELNRMEDGIEEGIAKAEQAEQIAQQSEQTANQTASDLAAHLAEKAQDNTKDPHGTYTEFVQRAINVKWFGAKGDGVTDDTAAIQAAINAAQGIVYFPPGIYVISQTIVLPQQNLIIQGAGRDTTFIKANFTSGDTFYVNWMARFSDMTITSDVTKTAGFAINRNTSTSGRLIIRDVFIANHFAGINLSGTLNVIDNVDIRNITPTSGYGVLINGGTDQTINHLVIDNPATAQPLAGIYVKQTGALFLHECDIIHAGSALFIEPPAGAGVFSLYASNCYFDNSTRGLYITGTGVPRRFKFTNCWFCSHSSQGILIDNASADAIEFLNCYAMENQKDGITVLQASTWSIAHSTITGNVWSGISLQHIAGSFKIHGNKIGSTAEFGGNAYGIFFNSTGYYTGSITIEDNNLEGNTNSAIMLPSTATPNLRIKDNIGYNPVGLLTAPSVPASGSALTNPFCVAVRVFISGGTVSAIAINGTNTGLTSGSFLLMPGDTITLTYTAAPTWVWFGM